MRLILQVMNKLTFRRTDEDELTFELLVDGLPLGERVGAPGNGIPHRYVFDNLPSIPPYPDQAPADPTLRLVAVCKCGEYGCGYTACHVHDDRLEVHMSDFWTSRQQANTRASFTFDSANYHTVIDEIVAEARRFRSDLGR